MKSTFPGEAKQGNTDSPGTRETMASTGKKIRCVFIPQTMGIFILLIVILGFITGLVRKELALTLTAAVFLALWLYSLLMTLLFALLQRKSAGQVYARIRQREISVGKQGEVIFSDTGASGEQVAHNAGIAVLRRLRLPGVLMRYRLLLHTADGRKIKADFDPFLSDKEPRTFTANERGAFFSDYDELAVCDILGFFRFAYRIHYEAGYRLLVCPQPAMEPLSPEANTGGMERPAEFQLRRSDNLIDHRPYIPGDDPRRINWKLFGHGNELFVREGESEPPPHSNILILIDTHCDSMLYSDQSGRRGIDILCENALACALELINNGMNVQIGFTGMAEAVGLDAGNRNAQAAVSGVNGSNSAFFHGSSPSEIAAIFALPAAIPWPGKEPPQPVARQTARQGERQARQHTAQQTAQSRYNAELPAPPADCGILVFALPRANAESSALSRFLGRAVTDDKPSSVELIFMYEGSGRGGSSAGGNLDDEAAVCAAFYRRRQNLPERSSICVRLIKTGE